MPSQSNQSMNRVLSELKEQQRLNESALNNIKLRLNNDYHNFHSSTNNFTVPRGINNSHMALKNSHSNGTYIPIDSLTSNHYDSNLSNLSPEEIRQF